MLGIPSENLDLFFHTAETQKRLLARHSRGKDLVIAEGVMGYYDGMSLESPRGSTSEIAAALQMPVALVVPCRGMGHSVLACIKGYLEYEKTRQIRAVILNQISGRTYERLAPMLEERLQAEGYAVRMAGYFPKLPDAELKSRHLGLVLPEEVEAMQDKLDLLADQAEQTLDLDLLLELAMEAPDWRESQMEQIRNQPGRNGTGSGSGRPGMRLSASIIKTIWNCCGRWAVRSYPFPHSMIRRSRKGSMD